ncbi:MAG: sigma factor-like helix-turn-helix DNA-binding protein [Gammaproteobacteria bacterium]
MSDYAISVKVRNARIWRRIVECGFSTVNELCRKSGLHPERVGALLNLKVPPLMGDGRWRPSATALAEVLGCTCEDLFSETQRTLTLRDPHGECYITEVELLKLLGRVERPLLENPEEQLLEDADEEVKSAAILRALDGLNLAPRDRRIIESHFGIGCEPRTLTEIAEEHDVCYQLVQTRLKRALQSIRDGKLAAHRSLRQAYRPADAMGRAQEARERIAQKRIAALRVEKISGLARLNNTCSSLSTGRSNSAPPPISGGHHFELRQ